MIINYKLSRSISLILGLIGVLTFTGCKKLDGYLDKAESGGVTEEQLFNDYAQVQSYLANIYATGIGSGDWMPTSTFTYAAATDEALCPYPRPTSPLPFNNGTLSPTNNPIDSWNLLYQNIRKVNRFLEKIDAVPTTTPDTQIGKPRMKGEAYFLRAWFYAELFKRYGGVPIIDRTLNINENLNIPRNTDEEVVNFIVRNCDSAMVYLPAVHNATNTGRATKGAAMMLKARNLLYGASLLHNPSNDVNKWKLAAAASRAVMDLKMYSLDNNYKTLFHTRTSPEIIFQATLNQVYNVTSPDWVRNTQPPSQGGGWGNVQPLQNLVDAYEMTDGTPFNWSNPAHAANPYANRDPRMHYSIIYNGRPWAGSTIFTYAGAPDGPGINTASTQTGHYLAKLLDENSTLLVSYKGGSHYWVFMRYAETLLNYAEAQNEAAGPDQSVYDAINSIRTRPGVGMPPLPANLSKEQMRDRIRQERRVELAIETHRFWDVRRWRIGEDVFKTTYAMRVTKTGSTYTYAKYLFENRFYKPAYDLFPIPQSELERNTALVQNPGY